MVYKKQSIVELQRLWRECKKLQFDWLIKRVPTRTCQDAKWFPYPPPPFILHNFNVDPKSWHFDYYAKNNSRRGASGNTLPCLSFLLRPFQSTSPGLSHKSAIVYHWGRGHTISCNTIPCFVVPIYCTFQDLQVLLQTFEDNASLLGKSAQDRDNWASAAFLQPALAMIQRCKLQL